MTKTTVPFEQTSIETDYFVIKHIEEFETIQKYYDLENLSTWEKELAKAVDEKYKKVASLMIYYRFGKKIKQSHYYVYFNDVEDVIATLRLYYADKIKWLNDTNLAHFECQDNL